MAQSRALMESKLQLPGYWHFAWMFFMQPLTLHDQLKACGIAKPDIAAWYWYVNRKQLAPSYLGYILRSLFVWVVVLILAFGGVLLLNGIFHIPLDVGKMAKGVAFGLALGVARGMVGGMVGGVANGVAFSITFAMVFGVPGFLAYGMGAGVTVGVVAGVGAGVAFGVAGSLAGGVAFRDAGGGVAGLIIGWVIAMAGSLTVGIVVGRQAGPVEGVVAGAVVGVAFFATYFRLLFFPVELACQLLARAVNAPNLSKYYFSPLLYHDMAYLAYPFLAQQIVSVAQHNLPLAQQLLRAASRSVGQKKAAAKALDELRAQEINAKLASRDFAEIAKLRGLWLPGPDNDSSLLTTMAKAARFMLAGLGALSAHIRLQHFDAAARQLQAIENLLLTSQEPLARFLPPVLQTWREVLETARSEATAKAKTMLPNPFVAGTPLSPDMSWGQAVFRGRETLIQQVESLLADQQNTTSIALIGPRRCGKSSLLNMLRVMLPDTIVVLFDLQSNPVDTPTAFYEALAHTAREQAQRSHRLQLPELVFTTQNGQQKSPIEALKQWLDQLEQFSTQHRILICIDEFERLETLFPDQNRELLQLMGLFRATIQHGRRVRLLVAGAAPFDELGTLWNDHFINLREMRLGFLDEETVVQLLTKPIDEFPPGAISAELAHEIYRHSRGQPFLTQVYGYALVETLNRSKRKSATLDDIEQIEPELLSSYTYYFRGIWQEVPPEGQAALTALAHGKPITLARETKRWLRRRMLVDDAGQLLVPLFGRWIREKDEMV